MRVPVWTLVIVLWPHFSAGTIISEALPPQTRSSSLTACLNKAAASFHRKKPAAFPSRVTASCRNKTSGDSRTVGPAVFLIEREAKKNGGWRSNLDSKAINLCCWVAGIHTLGKCVILVCKNLHAYREAENERHLLIQFHSSQTLSC